jgi:hypothetical protein
MFLLPTQRMFAACFILITCVASAARAADADQKTEFLKFVDDGHNGGQLQTAIVDYKNKDGVVVHLVAAVHIADQPYYDGLNKTFKKYDAVLYEMVKPRDAAPPQPGEERSTNMISMIQRFMKDTLELKFQLDQIDYNAPNFVHADLDYETFEKMESDRGESIWSLMIQQMLRQMANPPEHQQEIGLPELLSALGSPDRARQLKMILGRQFGDIEDQMAGFAGTVLITERNKACFKVLDKEIADGKKNLGIFYGAGHMTDMEKRLVDLGFKKTDSQWRVAWNMSGDEKKGNDDAKPAPQKKPEGEEAPNGIIHVEYMSHNAAHAGGKV